MGLFSLVKTVMGLGTGSESRTGRTNHDDVDVTVEHEPDTESEDAVKGTGDDLSVEPDAEAFEEAEAAAVEGVTEDEEAAEDVAADEDTTGDEESDDAAVTVAPDLDSDDDVDTVSGIGPSYAERLGEAGIETVGDLAAADPADVATRSDLSEKRVTGWVATARGDE
ncbi:helix-hairpin-helix domain-containing protein [Halorientalis litorea]|jgi:predicted flap endonuclease-1-like 5' DNA nuclease|uniref:helix-hairpin-helix domain-containing protein n=1 Tax=Halorientalis litorea TaxID=2931977 RepID=UPI001FF57943|nr:helix-hairpin-helix domain-containing protein [Halorientalis litorea]